MVAIMPLTHLLTLCKYNLVQECMNYRGEEPIAAVGEGEPLIADLLTPVAESLRCSRSAFICA